jgi:cytochrome c oxidase subunit II
MLFHRLAPARAAQLVAMLIITLAVLSTGCTGAQSALDAASPQARQLARLSWWMFGTAGAVMVLVMALLLFGVLRGRRTERARPLDARASRNLVVGGGVILPLVAAVALLIGSSIIGTQHGASAKPPADAMLIEVTAHRWWWEVNYLDANGHVQAVTANEIRVPVGQPVRVNLKSSDVIHSFWAPNLQGKADMVPGRTNVAWFIADREGTYRGQCAEFCGLQHAKMAFYIVVQPEAEFIAWRTRQAQPAAAPASDHARRGREIFETRSCLLCHTVRGTAAMGKTGPDLTHVASRSHLAAGVLPNRSGQLAAWIVDPQGIKPGTLMPATSLSGEELQALLAYLQQLQ